MQKNIAEKKLQAFLKQYNCQFSTTSASKEDHSSSDGNKLKKNYYFDYQGGHFCASIYADTRAVEVTYPSFYQASLSDLSSVRALCNTGNQTSMLFKFFYTISSDSSNVNVHISFCDDVADAEEFKNNLDTCFMYQREFSTEIDKNIDESHARHIKDTETNYAHNSRELFLLRQQEISHNEQGPGYLPQRTGTGSEPLTLATAVSMLTSIEEKMFVFKQLEVVANGEVSVIASEDEIKGYEVARALVKGTGRRARTVTDHAVLVLTYTTATKLGNQFLTLQLQDEGRDESSIYLRLTTSIPYDDNDPAHSVYSNRVSPEYTSTLIAFDFASPKQKLQEFDYMWKDAQIKIAENKSDELTPEQELLADTADANISYCLYWGVHYFLSGRYIDAITLLKNAFFTLRYEWNKESSSGNKFNDVCYYLGFSYCELDQFDKAFYYLNFLYGIGRIDYVSEFVNCLANSQDPRVFPVINEALNGLSRNYDLDDPEDMPQELASFISFLHRRHAFALVDFDRLDEAEAEFKALLDDPESSDFAINELAYIKRLRDEEKQAKGASSKKAAGKPKAGSRGSSKKK